MLKKRTIQRGKELQVLAAFKTISNHLAKTKNFDTDLLNAFIDGEKTFGVPDLVNPKRTAALLGCTEKTLANKRVNGDFDLPFLKIGSRVMYRRSDLINFISRNSFSSTSERKSK